MNVLGIGGYSHDSSAALVCDGKTVAAAEEERFTRNKHQEGWPNRVIDFCLQRAGIGVSDLDHIAFYWRPWGLDPFRSVMQRILNLPRHPAFSAGFLLNQLHTTAMFTFHLRRLRQQGGNRARIHYVRHHDCHAGGVFFPSPFDEAAVLTIDSRGEWATSVMYHGKGNSLERVGRINLPNSIGQVYLCTTNFLGFRTGDEYKIMGLAAFGEPRYLDKFRKIVHLGPGGTYRVDRSYFKIHHSPGRYMGYVTRKYLELFGPQRQADDEITQEHKDIAASLQACLEETMFHVLTGLHNKTGSKNLCLSGGVAQNSVMCAKIEANTPFENVFLQSASGDNGCSLGAAEWVHHQVLGLERGAPFASAYLGPEYSEEEIAAFLDVAKLDRERPGDLVERAADLVADGKIVGWFQGRMEWGARALGSRSILADVTNPEMTNIVNRYVKHREDFRPFAPACTEEDAPTYFDCGGPSPYMLKVFPALQPAKDKMPAVVHVDGSARLQTVNRDQNPLFHDLLRAIQKRKGVPCVLNTSFNIKGEPIVCSPMDAVKCWASTGIDALVIGPFVLEKSALAR